MADKTPPTEDKVPPENKQSKTLPETLEEAHGEIVQLRREAKQRRESEEKLRASLEETKTSLSELEAKTVSNSANSSELLKAKDARIKELETRVSSFEGEDQKRKDGEARRKERLLVKLPETIREKYKDYPLDFLESIVEDFKLSSEKKEGDKGSEGEKKDGGSNDPKSFNFDEELEKATLAGDEKRINELLDGERK